MLAWVWSHVCAPVGAICLTCWVAVMLALFLIVFMNWWYEQFERKPEVRAQVRRASGEGGAWWSENDKAELERMLGPRG